MTDETIDELRLRRQAEMLKSLECAIAVWEDFGARSRTVTKDSGIGIIALSIDDVGPVLSKAFGVPLHHLRVGAFIAGMNGIIMEQGGLTSCGLWDAAHLLDHILYDAIEDFKEA